MIQITWQGHYLDGKTADKEAVEIQLLNEGLKITTKAGVVFLWPYSEIRQTQGFYGSEPVQLERGGKIPEILLLSDHEFLTSLHNFAPKAAKKFHNPAPARIAVAPDNIRGSRYNCSQCVFLYLGNTSISQGHYTAYSN